MGGSSSSTRISVESEDAEGIGFVKGIRLTDRVVDRMKETPQVQDPQSKSSTYAPYKSETLTPTEPSALKLPHPPSYASALVPPLPLQESTSPLVPNSVPSVQKQVVISTATNSVTPAPPAEPLPIPTSPLTVIEPVAMPLPAETVPVVLSFTAEAVDISPPPPTINDNVTSPPPTELKAIPVEFPTTPLTNDVLTAPPVKAIHLPSTIETIDIPVESSFPSTPTLTPDATSPVEQAKLPTTPTSEPVAKIELPLLFDKKLSTPIESVEISKDMPPSPVKSSDLSSNLEEFLSPPSSSALPLPCEHFSVGQIVCPPTEDTPASRPVVEPANAPALPALTETLSPLTQIVVKEEDLRKQIREELQKLLQEERKTAALKIQQQLEEEKANAKADAQAKAQQQIQAVVEKILKKEQLALQQTRKYVIIQECKSIQVEQLLHQYYWMERKIQKLEKKERDLAKQDLMYKEQLAKLEEKTAKFTRVTAESFRKGLEETHKRFKRYQIKPVCSELQIEILKCYLQNTGTSLICSSIASQYVKCVNNAKQNKKLSTEGQT